MRFRRKLGANVVIAWVLSALFAGFVFLRTGHSFYAALLAVVVVLLLYALPHFYWYWDVFPDRLVNRRHFGKRTFAMADIVYAGPMPGHMTPRRGRGAWIEVRTRSDERMIVQPADAEKFLAELGKYVPAAVTNPAAATDPAVVTDEDQPLGR